jgi:Ion channel
MYWAMSTMATVGYGDITPHRITEKLIAMAGMLVGVTIFAYIMGTVATMLSTLNARHVRVAEVQQKLDGFCRTHGIPKALAHKLEQYFDYVMPRQLHTHDSDIIATLPHTLQQQVHACLCCGCTHACADAWWRTHSHALGSLQVILTLNAPLFDKLPFFKHKHPQLLQHLLPHLKLEYYIASEYVIWQDDRSTEMYFISDGLVEARVNIDPRRAAKGKCAFCLASRPQPLAPCSCIACPEATMQRALFVNAHM